MFTRRPLCIIALVLLVALCSTASFADEKVVFVPNGPEDVADTSIQLKSPEQANFQAQALPAGKGAGPEEDAHLLIRFDRLPKLRAEDIKTVRLGLYRQWKNDPVWDGANLLLMVLPSPKPFDEQTSTWNTEAAKPKPNATIDENTAKFISHECVSVYITTNPKGQGEYKWADVTNFALVWLDSTSPNNGLLTLTDYYRSSPHPGSAMVGASEGPAERRPVLEITYYTKPASAESPRHTVVYPQNATHTERSAVRELVQSLRSATGRWYEALPENLFDGKTPAIYVGWTKYAAAAGIDANSFATEEYEIRPQGENLILCGSRPRGNLYAVAEYLESFCGFRWFTVMGEVKTPRLDQLPLPKAAKRYQPAFTSRDLMIPYPMGDTRRKDPGMAGVADLQALDRWMAMNRINGSAAALHYPQLQIPSVKYGRFYQPFMNGVHTLPRYIDCTARQKSDPEWMAMFSSGTRSNRNLCFSNQQMRKYLLKVLREDIRKRGEYGTYSISPPDGASYCSCPDCKRMAEKHGSPAASYVEMLNYLGSNIADEFPRVRLELLAYGSFQSPPRDMRCEPNVLIRCALIYKLQWDRLDFAGNESQIKDLEGWLKVDPKQLQVWDYPHHYGTRARLYPVARTDAKNPAVLRWLKRALANKKVARAGLGIATSADTKGKHYISLDGGMNVVADCPVVPLPTLIVNYRANGQLKKLELAPSTLGRVSSDSPDTPAPKHVQYVQQSAQVTGSPNAKGLCSMIYVRYDLAALPRYAKIVDAVFEISKNGEKGADKDGTFEVYAVRPGSEWNGSVTWNSRPKLGSRPIFKLPAYKGYDGFEKYEACFPQPNLFTILENLRQYRQMGVRGMFLETSAALLDQHCMPDIVYWVLAKGMWDTSRSGEEIVRDYCDSYFGPAAADIFAYLKALDSAYKSDPIRIPGHVGTMSRQQFFSYEFARDAQKIFDKATAKVANEPELHQRVVRARAAQDLATLFYLNRFEAEYHSANGSLEGFPFDRKTLEQRYRDGRMTMIKRFYPRRGKNTENEMINKMFSSAKKMPAKW